MKRPTITAADGSEEPALPSTIPDDAETPGRLPTSVQIDRLKLDLRTCHTRIIDLEQAVHEWRQRAQENLRRHMGHAQDGGTTDD